ncbi:MAG: hypothetical protein K8R56_02660, partial [Candidatus Eisenbacteria bacterium]|nr:hypothetical protein [Candidatus Eisenbacteria bacterium]
AGIDRNSMKLERGDADGWLRGGALGDRRSGVGVLGPRGDHVWFLDAARIRGAHTLRAAYAQRGAANTTRRDDRFVDLVGGFRPPYLGFEEAARGESGTFAWEWAHGVRHASARFRRSHDHRESFEAPFENALFVFAEREAQENGATFDWGTRTGGHETGMRLEFTQAQVERSADFLNTLTASDRKQRTAWLAARHARPLAGGQLEAQAGVGYQSAPDVRAERLQAAPSIEWSRGQGVRRLRLHAGRIVTPVWSDLAPNTNSFTQDAWVAGLETGVGDDSRRWLKVGALGTSAGAAAQMVRFPVRDISLRYGWLPSSKRTNDVMGTFETGVQRGPIRLEASGFARVRPRVAFETQSDPAVGARAAVQAGFRLFKGDLGVTLRVEGGYIGEREFAALPEFFVPPTTLPGHMTFDGLAMIDLGDARIGVRALTLEDEQWPEVWADPSAAFPGKPAIGAGRQIRFEVAWPFFN